MRKIATGVCNRMTLPLLCLLLMGLLPARSPLSAADEPRSGLQITVLATTKEAITLQATVDSYTVEPVALSGEQWQRIDIAGAPPTTLPGAPQLPSRGALVGVPTTAGVTFQVLAADFEALPHFPLAPAPPLAPTVAPNVTEPEQVLTGSPPETAAEVAAIYATDAFYPGPLVELGEVGNLRDQPVAQVQFYPVQYNPVRGELRLYHRLVVQLTWRQEAVAAAADARGSTPAYEELLRNTLLNYTTLTRPSGPGTPVVTPPDRLATAAVLTNSSPRLKVGVNQDGLYKLTPTDLSNAGFDPSAINPQTLKLHKADTEVAILVTGAEDGRFDGADAVIFYGQALRSAYSTTNIYWLSAGGSPGLRMAQRSGAPLAGAVVPDHFPTTLHAEQDTVYWQTMLGSGEDRWFWDKRLSPNTKDIPTSRSYPVRLGAIMPTATATLRVRLKGYTSLAHHTRLYLNDTWVDDKRWQGQIEVDHQVTIDQALLKDGDNLIRVEAVESGAVVDQLLVNWIELDYGARYLAENNRLWFSAPAAGAYQFDINNFADADVTIFDITDAANPVQLINVAASKAGRAYKVTFGDTAQAASRYVAWLAAQYNTPAFLQMDEPSAWQSPSNGADMIIITHADFYTSALLLAEYRRTQGLRVATVKVDDLYDEFSDGNFHPGAIQKFLAYAYQNWQAPAPTYVLLIGDANQDYKDNLQNGTRNFVPSFNIDSTLFGEVSSDNRFVSVSGNDALPDLFIGRLVAQSAQEAQNMVAKIIAYEQQSTTAAWNRQVLLVNDDGLATFSEISEQVAAALPYYYTINRVAAGVTPDPHAAVLYYLNQGNVLVNYAGHGEFFAWGINGDAGGYLLHEGDVAGLANGDKLPVITVANCLNGFFAGPMDKPALAETLLRSPNAGAVAMWAPTSLGYPTGHKRLIQEFYRGIFASDRVQLGAATTQAQLATFAQSSFWRELVETYVLFGDPATKLAIPPNFPYVRTTLPMPGATAVALDEEIKLHFTKPMNPESVGLVANPADVTFTPTWNADQTVVTFTHTLFVYGETYQLSLLGQDLRGNALGAGPAPNPWTLVATTDNVAPGAVITAPLTGLSAILTTQPLSLVFTEPVRPASVTYAITPDVGGALRWEMDGQRATFVHDRFAVGKTYTFTLLAATDRAGNKLEAPVQASFTVGETFYRYFPFTAK